jgi:hypothetical protein
LFYALNAEIAVGAFRGFAVAIVFTVHTNNINASINMDNNVQFDILASTIVFPLYLFLCHINSSMLLR